MHKVMITATGLNDDISVESYSVKTVFDDSCNGLSAELANKIADNLNPKLLKSIYIDFNGIKKIFVLKSHVGSLNVNDDVKIVELNRFDCQQRRAADKIKHRIDVDVDQSEFSNLKSLVGSCRYLYNNMVSNYNNFGIQVKRDEIDEYLYRLLESDKTYFLNDVDSQILIHTLKRASGHIHQARKDDREPRIMQKRSTTHDVIVPTKTLGYKQSEGTLYLNDGKVKIDLDLDSKQIQDMLYKSDTIRLVIKYNIDYTYEVYIEYFVNNS